MSKIAILGCPRSGTSLTAQLVLSAGFDSDMNGQKLLMRPNPKYNPDGYFERMDVVRLNDKLISEISNDYNFLNSPSIDEVKNFKSSNNELNILSKELCSYDDWFIKDSRLCFTMHLYKIPNLKIIKVIRNSKDVKLSMERHYGDLFNKNVIHGPHNVNKVDFDWYYKNINDCIDWQINNAENITVEYESLMNGNLEILEKFLGKTVNKDIIKPKYRNYG